MPLRSMPCVPLCGISGVVERAHSTGPVVLAAKCLPFRSAAALLAAPASFGGRLCGGAQTSCKTDQQALHDALRELPGVTPPLTGSSFPSSLSHSVSTLSSLSCDLLKHLMKHLLHGSVPTATGSSRQSTLERCTKTKQGQLPAKMQIWCKNGSGQCLQLLQKGGHEQQALQTNPHAPF